MNRRLQGHWKQILAERRSQTQQQEYLVGEKYFNRRRECR
jgi:hypothetical protein